MINIIGLGYIGLPTALMFSKNGVNIVGTDINVELVNNLNKGIINIDEEGISELFAEAVSNGIKFTNEYISTNMYIITVPTPYDANSKKINVEYVITALNNILEVCHQETTIIIESTISPGTVEKYVRPLTIEYEKKYNKKIHLAHAPERIIPGNMVFELVNNSRTIGADNETVAKNIKKLYESFCKAEIVTTDIKTAEMSKVVENTFRDINIAFANELAKICHVEGIDVYEIINIANKHPRVNILQPGPGVGGHCIPVDPWFLVGDYPNHTKLIKSAREVNSSMPKYVLERIIEVMKVKNITDFSNVGIYGLAYKENIDDVRESPSLQLLQLLKEQNIMNVRVYDPYVKEKIVSNQFINLDKFMENLNLIVVLVAHDDLFQLDISVDNLSILDTKSVLSGSNVFKL